MRPVLTLVVASAVLAAGVAAATVWPAAAPAGPVPGARPARDLPVSTTTLVCPSVPERRMAGAPGAAPTPVAGTLGVVVPQVPTAAGAAGPPSGGLTVTTLGGDRLPVPASPTSPVVTPVPAHSGPLVVTARGAGTAGTAAMVTARLDGSGERGLASGLCRAPQSHWWFLAPGTQVGRRPALVLVNPQASPVQVDLELFGPTGPVRASAATGIVLAAHHQTVVPLDALAPDLGALAVHVTAQGGRVAAALWDTEADGLAPRGVDWVPPAAPPARRQAVPVVPVGQGERTLYVTAPGAQEAVVAVRVLGPGGSFAPSGRESLVVPAGAVAELDVANLIPAGAEPAPVGILLRADVPVTAATGVRVGSAAGAGELTWAPAGAPLQGPAVLALARAGQVTRTELALAAPAGAAAAQVDVEYPGGRRASRRVTVAAGAVTSVPLAPPGDVTWYQVLVRPVGAAPVLAAATVREGTGNDEWITLTPLVDMPRTVHEPRVVRDLGVGAP